MNNGNNPYQNTYGSVAPNPAMPQQPMNPAQAQATANTFGNPAAPADGTKEEGKTVDKGSAMKTVFLVVTSMLSVLFIGLFVWMWVNWSEAKTNVEGRINLAVAEAENALQTKLETEFAAKEKYPNRTFSGPSDYGSLTFEYPKTWSVYISSGMDGGGKDFNAFLNPGQVSTTDTKSPIALRVSITSKQTDSVIKEYNQEVKKGKMTIEPVMVNGISVNVYTGELKSSKLQGYVCIFKIRDKTAILQTDALLYHDDFYSILNTIRFNS